MVRREGLQDRPEHVVAAPLGVDDGDLPGGAQGFDGVGVADAVSGLIVFDVMAVEVVAEPCVFLVAGQGDRDPVSWPQSMLAGGAASENDEGRAGRAGAEGRDGVRDGEALNGSTLGP